MPDTPMSDSAARTSSSLNGLMMAVTSFMRISVGAPRANQAGRPILHLSCHDTVPGNRRFAVMIRRLNTGLHYSSAAPPAPGTGMVPHEGPAIGYSSGMQFSIVIVGAGQAATQAIDTLRRKGFTGSIALIGAEQTWP